MDRNFDYVVVSIMNAEVSKQIRECLSQNVEEDKIVLMGYDDMCMDKLDELFGND